VVRADLSLADLSLEVQPDSQAVALAAADVFCAQVGVRPDLTVLVATGSTPMATYAELARRVRAGTLDLSRVTAVQLDEYLGLETEDPRSLWDWMQRSFVAPLGITRTVRFGQDSDTERTCAQYGEAVRALGGIDLAILGLGPNGHLGFNEPPSAADAPTRRVMLSPASLESNRAYWNAEVPTHALTAGMDVILAARRTLLLVTGPSKRAPLQRLLSGPPGPDFPASLLGGPGMTVLADQAATSRRAAEQTDHGTARKDAPDQDHEIPPTPAVRP
jgi:glucosamine-6-phosphate deaminase